jgi:hypothetical protein
VLVVVGATWCALGELSTPCAPTVLITTTTAPVPKAMVPAASPLARTLRRARGRGANRADWAWTGRVKAGRRCWGT